jgi:hypothetical protein
MSIRVDHGSPEIIVLPGAGAIVGAGTTVPPSASIGWAHGAVFHHTDGTTGIDATYINAGTKSSSSFTPLDASAADGSITADTISEYTAAAGVTIDGLLVKDGNVDLNETGKLIVSASGGSYITGTTGQEEISFTTDTAVVAKFITNGLSVDVITELTAASGVDIDSVILKDGIATAPNGIKTKQAVTQVHDTTPTIAELTTAFGDPATLGRGFIGTVDDNDGDTNAYMVFVTDASFYFLKFTKAAA